MAKQYVYIKVWKETRDKLNQRVKSVNDDLKMMGVKGSIPKIHFMDTIAKRTFFIPDIELIKMARRKRKC